MVSINFCYGAYCMFNKKMIDKMLEMSDERLLAMLKIVLASAGIDLGKKTPDAKTVRKIRALLGEITDADIERVIYLADRYKNGG